MRNECGLLPLPSIPARITVWFKSILESSYVTSVPMCCFQKNGMSYFLPFSRSPFRIYHNVAPVESTSVDVSIRKPFSKLARGVRFGRLLFQHITHSLFPSVVSPQHFFTYSTTKRVRRRVPTSSVLVSSTDQVPHRRTPFHCVSHNAHTVLSLWSFSRSNTFRDCLSSFCSNIRFVFFSFGANFRRSFRVYDSCFPPRALLSIPGPLPWILS